MFKHVLTRSSNRWETVSPLKMTSPSSQTWLYLRFSWKHRCCLKMPEPATLMCHLNSTPPLQFDLRTNFPRPQPSTAHILKENAERGYIAINTISSNTHLRINVFFPYNLRKNIRLQAAPEELSPFIPPLLTISSLHKGALNCGCGSQILPQ